MPMSIDTATLMAAGALTTALSGLLLLGVWTQIRRETALLLWAAANFAYAIGIAHLLVALPEHRPLGLAVGVIYSNICPPLIWCGARRFGGRRIPKALLLGVTLTWIIADLVSEAAGPEGAGAAISFAGWVAFLLAATWELWRDRAERLWPRWAVMTLFSVHAAVYAGGVYDVLAGNFPEGSFPPLNSWFGIIFFEGLFYPMGTALFMALLSKERSELGYIKAAGIDTLTGTANRRAFFDSA